MKYTAAEVAEAVRQTNGVVTRAAEELGCDRSTVYNYADRYVTVREALQTARSGIYAEAQHYLVAMMRDREHKDHRWAVEQVLKHYGDTVSDGLDFSDRKRLEHTEAEPVEFVVTYESAEDQ